MAELQPGSDDRTDRIPPLPELLENPGNSERARIVLLNYFAPRLLVHALRVFTTRGISDAFEEARDVVQQFLGQELGAIIDGYEKSKSPDDTIQPWLWTHFRHTLSHKLRSIMRYRRHVKVLPADDDWKVTLEITGATPDRFLAGELEDLQAAINELDPLDRKMIVEVDLEGMSLKEFAKSIGINYGAVRTRHTRVKQKLKELMTKRVESK